METIPPNEKNKSNTFVLLVVGTVVGGIAGALVADDFVTKSGGKLSGDFRNFLIPIGAVFGFFISGFIVFIADAQKKIRRHPNKQGEQSERAMRAGTDGGGVAQPVERRADHDSLPRFCLGCDYCLTGIDAACPECGKAFTPDDPATYHVDRPLSAIPRRFRAFILGITVSSAMLMSTMCFALGMPGNAPAPWFIEVPIFILAPGIALGSPFGFVGMLCGLIIQFTVIGLLSVGMVEWVHRRNPRAADRFCRKWVRLF